MAPDDIPELVHSICEATGWTQEQLAKKILFSLHSEDLRIFNLPQNRPMRS
jgi:hypothetical protein